MFPVGNTKIKMGPLPRVFQIVLRGRGMGNLPRGNFSVGWWESGKEWFLPLKPFSKLKTTFCKYWTLIKIKISKTCVCKECEGKIKMVQDQWLQLKMKFLFSRGMNLWWGIIKSWGWVYWENFLGGRGMSKFLASGGGTPLIPPPVEETLLSPPKVWKILNSPFG